MIPPVALSERLERRETLMREKRLRLLSAAEAGELLGKDPRTVTKWVRRSEVPGLGVEIAGRVYVRRAVLEKLIGEPIPSETRPRVADVGDNPRARAPEVAK